MKIVNSIKYNKLIPNKTTDLVNYIKKNLQQVSIQHPETKKIIDHFSDKIINNKKFFENLGVFSRDMVINTLSQTMNDWWTTNASLDPLCNMNADLYLQAVETFKPAHVDRLIIVTNQIDTITPNMGMETSAIIRSKMEDETIPVPATNLTLSGEGCSGLINGFKEAELWLKVNSEDEIIIIVNEVISPFILQGIALEFMIMRIIEAKNIPDEVLYNERKKELQGALIQQFLFGDAIVGFHLVADDTSREGISINKFHAWQNIDPDDRLVLQNKGIGTKSLEFCPLSRGYFYQQPTLLLEDILPNKYLPALCQFLKETNISYNFCAIHTGSGPILQVVADALGLSIDEIKPSLEVLQQYGNINAATGAMVIHNRIQKCKDNGESLSCVHLFAVFFGIGFNMQIAWGDQNIKVD